MKREWSRIDNGTLPWPGGLGTVQALIFGLKIKKMKKKRTIKNNNYKARIFCLESKPKVMKHFTFVPPKVSV